MKQQCGKLYYLNDIKQYHYYAITALGNLENGLFSISPNNKPKSNCRGIIVDN